MTRDDLFDLFLLMRGYWPHSAPDPENEADVAFYWNELQGFKLETVADALRELSRTKEFCPPIGIIAEAVRSPTKVPPYFDDYVDDAPALEGEGETLMGIPVPESFPPDSPVPGYIAAARAHLEQIAEDRNNSPNWRSRPAAELEDAAAARTATHEAAIRAADGR